MAVHIRLRRIGKNPKKRPYFRVTIFDQRRGRDSRFIEEIGFYNPLNGLVKINKERFDFWVKNGAQASQTVKSLVKKITKEAKNAARRIAIGSFAYAGQVCIAVQRIYVHKSIYEHFYGAFEKVVKNEIVTGDPMKEETVVGPVIDDASADRIMEWVNEAKKNGAKALIEGKRSGRLIEPIVLTNVHPSMKVSCKEIFGPVVTIESYDKFSDAIERVNNSVYGLQCGVFTKNLDYVRQAFNEIEVGGVIINDYPTFRVDNMPYGGVKESGFGREGIKYAIEEMMELKLLVLNFH